MEVIILLCLFLVLTAIILSGWGEQFRELGGRVSPSAMALRAKSPINPNLASFPKHGLVDFGDLSATEEHTEGAQRFHDQYEVTEDQRRRDILAAYGALDKPMVVVVMFYCKKFMGLFENWVGSCDAKGLGVRTRTIGFCLDQESYNRTKELGFQAVGIPRMSGEYRGFGGRFGAAFGETMFYKNSIIYDTLRWMSPSCTMDPIPISETFTQILVLYI